MIEEIKTTRATVIKKRNLTMAFNINGAPLNAPARGFSLIEVLVTLLILAVGLLSIAALQFKGLQYSNDAYMRSSYNILVYDIMDRMRNNSGKIADYTKLGKYKIPATAPSGCKEDTKPPTAENDINCWKEQLYAHLPPGSEAEIKTGTAKTGDYDAYDISITWDSRDGLQNKIKHTFANPK